jgi:hypothetical protein
MAGIEDLIRVFRGTENIPIEDQIKYPDRGKYFTTNVDDAKWYAQRKGTLGGKVNYLDLTKEKFEQAKNLSKVKNIRLPGEVIVDENLLKNQKLDFFKTLQARAGNLTNLAKKGLSKLVSLPMSVVFSIIDPTTANADEINMRLEDFAKLKEMEGMVDKKLPSEPKDIGI